jgi:radical SAM protein with 4Fe4S-binding SPASM domain
MFDPFSFFGSQIFPKILIFETNTKCEAHCTFCTYDLMKKREPASDELIDKIIKECVPLAEKALPFYMQEPFLEPRMVEILKKIKEANPKAKTTLASTMGYFDTINYKDLIDSLCLDQLNISFYGQTEELSKKYQPGLDWSKTKSNIKEFFKYRKEQHLTKPEIRMQYFRVPELMKHFADFKKEWEELTDVIETHFISTLGGRLKDFEEFSYHGSAELEEDPRGTPCPQLWSMFNVLSNGDVTPCCADDYDTTIMGNMNEQSAQEIWHGEKFNNFRQLHINRKFKEIPLCKDCTVWKYSENSKWKEEWKKI